MTVTRVAGSAVGSTGSTFVIPPPAGSVGDLLILSVRLYKPGSPSGSDTISVPSGWTSLGGVPEPGVFNGALRSWWKVATSGDLAGSTTVTFGTAWSAFTADRQGYMDAFQTDAVGPARIIGPWSSGNPSAQPSGSTASPTLPPAGVDALGYLLTLNGYSGGALMSAANGWTPDDANGPLYHAYGSSPIDPPVFDTDVSQQGWHAMWITDIPLASGWRIGLGMGRNRGWNVSS